MPKLVKLETDANVSNYTPEAGNITTFFAEENGAVKLKYKNSAGEIADLSGKYGEVVEQPVPTIKQKGTTITASYVTVPGLVEKAETKFADPLYLIPSTPSDPSISFNVMTGLITALSFYTPGYLQDTVTTEKEYQLIIQGEQTITPGTSDKTIAASRYLTGVQTIKGDTHLVPGHIKKGVSIFGVTGAYEANGGTGVCDLVAVTSYTPSYNKISSLTLSDMVIDENSGYDLTHANGVYRVTEETADKLPQERVYKHTSQEYYIFYIPEDTTGMYYSYGWALNTRIVYDPWAVMMMAPYSMRDLTEGTMLWSGEMNMLYMNVTIGNIQQEQMVARVKAKKVAEYNVGTLQYSVDSEEFDLPFYDRTDLKVHQIYNCKGTTIFGRPVDCEGGSHLRTYIPGRTEPITLPQKSERSNSIDGYYFYAWQYPSFHTGSPERFSLATIDGKACIYNSTAADHIGLGGSDLYATGKLGYYPSTANRYWSFGALFNSGGQKSKKQMLMVDLSNVAKVYIDVEWNASTPRAVLYVGDGNAVATYSNSDLSSGWHHFLMTYDFDIKTLTMYVDGVSRGTHTVLLERTGYYDGIHPWISRDSSEWYIGHVCEIKFWDVPLTATQASAEYARAITS